MEGDSVSSLCVSALCSVVQSSIVQLASLLLPLPPLWGCDSCHPLLGACGGGRGVGVVIVAAGTRGRGRGEMWGLVATRFLQPLWPRLTEMLTQLKQIQRLELQIGEKIHSPCMTNLCTTMLLRTQLAIRLCSWSTTG